MSPRIFGAVIGRVSLFKSTCGEFRKRRGVDCCTQEKSYIIEIGLTPFHSALHMREPLVRPPVLALADFEQRVSIKFDRREVLKKRYVAGLAFRALKLLASQRGAVLCREFINTLTNDYTNVLQPHLVNTPMDWRYQLDHARFEIGTQSQWLFKLHDGHWAPIPDVLYVRPAMRLNFVSFLKVFFVGLCPVGEVAYLAFRDINLEIF
jgi:hypothetical protein